MSMNRRSRTRIAPRPDRPHFRATVATVFREPRAPLVAAIILEWPPVPTGRPPAGDLMELLTEALYTHSLHAGRCLVYLRDGGPPERWQQLTTRGVIGGPVAILDLRPIDRGGVEAALGCAVPEADEPCDPAPAQDRSGRPDDDDEPEPEPRPLAAALAELALADRLADAPAAYGNGREV